jgi:hypothetical protein
MEITTGKIWYVHLILATLRYKMYI